MGEWIYRLSYGRSREIILQWFQGAPNVVYVLALDHTKGIFIEVPVELEELVRAVNELMEAVKESGGDS